MIDVESLLYEIDFKLNKLSSLQHQQIPDENKLIALNQAQIALIKNKIGDNNTYQLGFEAFKKRYTDLEGLVEPFHDHPLPLKKVDDKLNKWEASLEELSPKLMFYIDSYALANKEECKDVVIYVNNDLTKNADVTTLLNNSNYVPSFEYRETFNTLGKNKLGIYSDGSFDFTTVYVAYLRYPKKIDIEGYVGLDGTPSQRQDCELPEYLKDELINFTLLELGFSTENINAIQSAQARIQIQE